MPQIDENKLNEYADAVFDRCNYFNDYVLETIGRRIKATGQLSAADQAALKNMADISGDMDAITKKLAEITGQNIADIEAIYTQVLTDGVNTYEPLYDLKGMTFLPFEQNEFAKQLVRHWAAETAGELVNLSRTKALCFDRYNLAGEVIGSTPLAGAFQKAIDDAVIAVSTGTVDFNAAMRKTVEQLGGSGVKVHYGSGVNRSLSAMVRQNLLYGAKRASQAYEEQVGKELGCDGFEVDYHAHPRPSHAFMGGRMYSYKGTVRIGGRVYEDGAEALERLSDYGCLHFKTDVILGISEPRYDEAWLSAQKRKDAEPIAFDRRQKTAYEWQQVQRELERAVRRENSTAVMARASGDKVLARRCREKTAAYREKYDALCDAVGLEKRYNRMAAYGAKAVDNAEKRGIIEMGWNDMYRKSRIDKIEPMPKKQLHKIEKGFKKNGGIFQYDKETDAYLENKNAEAITYDANTILLKTNAGRASVFEELIHATQYKQGMNDGSYRSRLECEIAAQEKLLRYSRAYKLTDLEIKQTKQALEEYQAELKAYDIKGGE